MANPTVLEELRQLIRTHPIIDHHAHNILRQLDAIDYEKYPLEQTISEASGLSLRSAKKKMSYHRAIQQLSELFGCEARWDAVVAARTKQVKLDYSSLVKRCLAGTHALLLDNLLQDDNLSSCSWHDQFTSHPTKRIVRIETIAAELLQKLSAGLTSPLAEKSLHEVLVSFEKSFRQCMQKELEDEQVVGFKSVICYRVGLDIDVSILHPANTQSKPIQLHTGYGDSDISLVYSNPAYLQPLIEKFPDIAFVLLHSAYPYTREAGYLAEVFPNVYLDLSLVFPMVSRDGQESIVIDSLNLAPSSKLLWSTDGHSHPESYWLATRQFREILEHVLVKLVKRGDVTPTVAREMATDILFNNSNRLYSLGIPEGTSSTVTQDTIAGCSLESRHTASDDAASDATKLINGELDAFVWLQMFDYSSTLRVRIVHSSEFLKLVRKQRRMGTSRAMLNMLANDQLAGAGTATGQFYLQPDVSSLWRNVGLLSNSLSVMTFWEDEQGSPLDGCPRSNLERIVDKCTQEFGFILQFGFEIEVVLARIIRDPSGGDPDYEPTTTNHSWTCMTTETASMVSLLEEIVTTLRSIGVTLEQFHAESSPGQFEFVLPPASPLVAVDTLMRARQAITNIAAQHDLRATLYPRPWPGAPGTAAHAHFSISPTTYEDAFLAGILYHFQSIAAFTLPQDASYTRVAQGIWSGGEWVTWGTHNREAPIRKISAGHWELKQFDGLANVYLAMSALVGAGYSGVSRRLELTHKDCKEDASLMNEVQRSNLGITTQIPKTLEQSLVALESDGALQEILGEGLVKSYVAVKRAESTMLSAMPEVKRRRYLMTRF
ncbi:hypothetical protein V2G26_015670 [Clonostachys chloroleuca]